jgi:hypothetical protein
MSYLNDKIPYSWIVRCKETEKTHKELVRQDPAHTIADTAKFLKRGFGSVSEDLILASWIRTHPHIESIPWYKEALKYVRAKKKEYKVR